MSNLKEKALENQFKSISLFCENYFKPNKSFEINDIDKLTGILAEKFKITKINAEKFKNKWLVLNPVESYTVRNYNQLLSQAKEYEQNLIAKKITLDEKFLTGFINNLSVLYKTDKEKYAKGRLIFQYITRNDT